MSGQEDDTAMTIHAGGCTADITLDSSMEPSVAKRQADVPESYIGLDRLKFQLAEEYKQIEVIR